MASIARRIVSTGKRRFTDEESGIDIDAITDRILIMGWPAVGIDRLYRNDARDVSKFLEARHGKSFRIFNFCPRAENEYPASLFHGQVSRFPFPDHHAPPFSMIPLYTSEISRWLDEDPERIAVIHCKAGKGRSGTMVCCYLLSLPELPKPPALARNYSPDHRVSSVSSGRSSISADVTDGRQRAEKLIAHLRENASTEQVDSPIDIEDETTKPIPNQNGEDSAASEALALADRLAHVFQLHTDQRMANPKEGKYGISIASQRRWVQYWARILESGDPRPWLSPSALSSPSSTPRPRRHALLLSITLHMSDKLKSLPPPLAGKRVSVSISRYNEEMEDLVERRERELKIRTLASQEGRAVEGEDVRWNDDDWPDRGEMFERIGTFSQVKAEADGAVEDGVRYLTPKDETIRERGFQIDGDRQVLLKLLIGKSGSKHGLLPDVASLGYAWVLLAFESSLPDSDKSIQSWTISGSDVDFLKPQAGLTKVELKWRWA